MANNNGMYNAYPGMQQYPGYGQQQQYGQGEPPPPGGMQQQGMMMPPQQMMMQQGYQQQGYQQQPQYDLPPSAYNTGYGQPMQQGGYQQGYQQQQYAPPQMPMMQMQYAPPATPAVAAPAPAPGPALPAWQIAQQNPHLPPPPAADIPMPMDNSQAVVAYGTRSLLDISFQDPNRISASFTAGEIWSQSRDGHMGLDSKQKKKLWNRLKREVIYRDSPEVVESKEYELLKKTAEEARKTAEYMENVNLETAEVKLLLVDKARALGCKPGSTSEKQEVAVKKEEETAVDDGEPTRHDMFLSKVHTAQQVMAMSRAPAAASGVTLEGDMAVMGAAAAREHRKGWPAADAPAPAKKPEAKVEKKKEEDSDSSSSSDDDKKKKKKKKKEKKKKDKKSKKHKKDSGSSSDSEDDHKSRRRRH